MMITTGYQIRQCENPECEMRYPIVDKHIYGLSCPRCGSKTRLILAKALKPESGDMSNYSSNLLFETLIDNIRSAWNVGSMFRTADGLGIRHMYLCGLTPTPDNVKVTKTSLGAEKTVTWSQHNDGVKKVYELNQQGKRLWALESGVQSENLFNILHDREGPPIILVVGNEVCGVDPGILELCDRTVHIPMIGYKRSFNAAVAFGIASQILMYGKRF